MEKHVSYYKRKTECYRKIGDRSKLLRSYFYLQERYFYNEVENSIEYKEFKAVFKFIFEKLINTMDNLELIDVEGIYAYSLFLLDLGYLVYDQNLEYNSISLGVNELPILAPLTLNRHGKCRHNTALLRELLKSKGKRAYILAGVKENVEEFLAHQIQDYKNPNHAIVVAEDDNFSYLLDPSSKEIFSIMLDDSIYSDKLTRFTLCQNRLVSLGDEIFFNMIVSQPLKNIENVRKNIRKNIDYIVANESELRILHKKISQPLKDAEDIYQRILKS